MHPGKPGGVSGGFGRNSPGKAICVVDSAGSDSAERRLGQLDPLSIFLRGGRGGVILSGLFARDSVADGRKNGIDSSILLEGHNGGGLCAGFCVGPLVYFGYGNSGGHIFPGIDLWLVVLTHTVADSSDIISRIGEYILRRLRECSQVGSDR